MSPNPQTSARFNPESLRLLVRILVFVALALFGQFFFPPLMRPFGNILVVSALSTFASAVLANGLMARAWERGSLRDFGLDWRPASPFDLAAGIGAGALATLLLLAGGTAAIVVRRNTGRRLAV